MLCSDNTIDCENCDFSPEPASLWCDKCGLSFCKNCFNSVHKPKALSNHEYIPIDQKPLPATLCIVHKEMLKYWCKPNQKLFCQSCLDFDTIENASKLQENQIIDERVKIEKKLEILLSNNNRYHSNCESARKYVKETFQLLRNTLDKKENELLELVNVIEKKNEKNYSNHNNGIQKIKNRLEKLSKEFEALLSPRNDVAILEQYAEFKDKFRTITTDLNLLKASSSINCSFRGFFKCKSVNEDLEMLRCIETRAPDLHNIPFNARWSTKCDVIIEGLSKWSAGLAIDQQNGTVFVADTENNRIVSWTPGEPGIREVVKNLKNPTNVVIDYENESLIIAEGDNGRVVRLSLLSDNNRIESIILNIECRGLIIDDKGTLYVTDIERHEVRRYPKGQKTGRIVAGGNKQGTDLHQLNKPMYVAVNGHGTVYVSDYNNHRVVKWDRGAEKGIIVAGFEGRGSGVAQLNCPRSILIDSKDNLYIADELNHRVVCYRNCVKTAEIIVDQLNGPTALAFDNQNNLYVSDGNGCVLRFNMIQ